MDPGGKKGAACLRMSAPARTFCGGTPWVRSTTVAPEWIFSITPFMIPTKGSWRPKSVSKVMIGEATPSLESTQTGNVPADREAVDILGAFISIHRLQIEHVANHWVFIGDAVSAQNVTGETGNL